MNQLKQDRFRKARGGWSRLLNLYCRKCNTFVARYQKDGSGSLRRLYLDRIFSPESLAKLQAKTVKRLPLLKCTSCGEILGTRGVYSKEKRKIFRLYQDAVIKKLRKCHE